MYYTLYTLGSRYSVWVLSGEVSQVLCRVGAFGGSNNHLLRFHTTPLANGIITEASARSTTATRVTRIPPSKAVLVALWRTR